MWQSPEPKKNSDVIIVGGGGHGLGTAYYLAKEHGIKNIAVIEKGWEGYVTLEFSNTTPLPAKIYANEGVAQFIFLKGNEKPEVTYADRNGKYMGQTGVTLPKV